MYRDYISKLVDDIVEVDDEEIAENIVYFLERAKTLVEGSGAIVLAGAEKAGWDLGKKSCLVLCGGNIDLNLVAKVIERGMMKRGRLIRISAIVPDRPGTLLRLTNIIAEKGANVLDVKHDRVRSGIGLSETAIEFLLETRSASTPKIYKKRLLLPEPNCHESPSRNRKSDAVLARQTNFRNETRIWTGSCL